MPMASLASDHPLARLSRAVNVSASSRSALDSLSIRCGLATASAISSAPCTAGSTQDGWTSTSRSGTDHLQPDGDCGGQRDRPPQLALGAALPGGNRPGGVQGRLGPGVQPFAGRAPALAVEPLRDRALELVDPLVQRPDPVQDLGRDVRRAGAARRGRPRLVVAHPRHISSVAGRADQTGTLVRDPGDRVADPAERLADPDPLAGNGGRLEPVGQPVERVEPLHARPPGGLGLPAPCSGARPRAAPSAATARPAPGRPASARPGWRRRRRARCTRRPSPRPDAGL